MRTSPTVGAFIISITALAVLNTAGNEFSLYERYTQYDTLMHMLGGMCVALALFAAVYFNISVPTRFRAIFPVLALALIVGLVWELFEIGIGIPNFEPNFGYDMSVDLLMDMLGGVLGYFIGSRLQKPIIWQR